ncbi:cyclic lactone autoinducer peptide [Fusibacter bizertensis]
MKKLLLWIDSNLASTALLASTFAANRVCVLFAYQPALPDAVKKLRKF